MSNEKLKKGRPRIYPIFDMQVGDSFIIQQESDVQKVRASISQMKRKHEVRDKKFKISPSENGSFICLRVL